MANKIESLRGMDDILPGEIEKWQWLEDQARIFFESRGYQEIRTPLVEYTELFSRSIGETSDIVNKEMYAFEDRGGRNITLRPEMTASIARSVIENSLLKKSPSLALYYMGPMFRAERPQAGRKRQFHQIGVEVINHPSSVAADFLTIVNLYQFIQFLDVKNIKLKINDLSVINGSQSAQIRKKIKNYFEDSKSELDKDSLYRLDKNVLRIFDSKDKKVQTLAAKTPWDEIAPLSNGFKQILQSFNQCGIDYVLDRNLVRGLDYYTGPVFEIVLEGLGAQDAVAGGGRYDNLFTELGAKEKVPCTGFSIGIERLIMSLEQNKPSISELMQAKVVYFAPFLSNGSDLKPKITQKVDEAVMKMRSFGFKTIPGAMSDNLSDHLKKANKRGAGFVVIMGKNEFEDKVWQLKNMQTGDQEAIKEGTLLNALMNAARGQEIL